MRMKATQLELSLSDRIAETFKDRDSFNIKEAYEQCQDKPATTVRGRIYDNIGKKFEKISRGVYRVIKGVSECLIVEGNGRDLSVIPDGSIDLIVTDYPWEDKKSNRGGNRNFVSSYEQATFQYTLEDFKEKARVLKDSAFLVEFLPAENESNYEELFRIKQLAKEAGFQYYAKVMWKKGTFVSNTGRKSKNSEDVMIFSKGQARALRLDAKKTKQTGVPSYMSGSHLMLPTFFDVQPASTKQKIHQAEKPVELLEKIIEHLSLEGECVLDQFAGSGNTGVAALKQNRNCVLVELLKENVEKINQRMQETFGNVTQVFSNPNLNLIPSGV